MRGQELGVASAQERRPQPEAGEGATPSSHTPGPWTFEAICFDRRIPIRGGCTVYGRPYNVALVNRPGSARAGEDKANASLIASAPELLEALKAVLALDEATGGEVLTAALEEHCRAAILKAEPSPPRQLETDR